LTETAGAQAKIARSDMRAVELMTGKARKTPVT